MGCSTHVRDKKTFWSVNLKGRDHSEYPGVDGREKSRDSSVGMALGYELDNRGPRVRFPAGARNFYLHHSIQNGSGAHPASYPMGTRGSFPGGEAAEA
jgi:hypothetical protein